MVGACLRRCEQVPNANWIELAPQKSPADPCRRTKTSERGSLAILRARSLPADLIFRDEYSRIHGQIDLPRKCTMKTTLKGLILLLVPA